MEGKGEREGGGERWGVMGRGGRGKEPKERGGVMGRGEGEGRRGDGGGRDGEGRGRDQGFAGW